MTTRTITGTILEADGTAWASATVSFRLLSKIAVNSSETYPEYVVTGTTDANGDFSVALVVPASGAYLWECKLPDETVFTFALESGAATTLNEIVSDNNLSSITTTGAIQALLAAYTLEDLPTTTKTADHTLTEADRTSVIVCNNSSAITITLPEDATENLDTVFQCMVIAKNTGNVAFAVEGSDNLYSPNSITTITNQYGIVLVQKVASGEWYLTGDLGKELEVLWYDVSRDESTALTTGTAKLTFRMPFAMTLTDARISVTVAPSTNQRLIVDVNESGTSIFSTELSIDPNEFTSEDANNPAVISDPNLADDAQMTVDVDQLSGGATEAGLKLCLIGYRS